jgi:hypothetical protein
MASPEFKVSPEQLQALETEREQLSRELEAAQQKQELLAQALREKEAVQAAPIAPVKVETPRPYVPTPSYNNTARVHSPKSKRGFLLALGGAFVASLFGGMYLMDGYETQNIPQAKVGGFYVNFDNAPKVQQTPPPINTVPAPIVRTGRIVNVEGGLALTPGASCTMVVKPNDLGNFNCRVNVTCENMYGGQSIVYGAEATGYGNCSWSGSTPLRFADRSATWQDGDGLLSYDLTKGMISIGDTNLNLDGYLVEIAINR